MQDGCVGEPVLNWKTPYLELDEDLLDDLIPYQLPQATTLSPALNDHFPNALAISFIANRLVVKLPETATEQYYNQHL